MEVDPANQNIVATTKTRTCANCGAEFQQHPRSTREQIYCKEQCRKEAWEREHRLRLDAVLIMNGIRYRLVPERLWLEMKSKEVMPTVPASTGNSVDNKEGR